MAIPPVSEPVPCPRCGSLDVLSFSDGSGKCRNCGNAFRGKGRLETGAAAAAGPGPPGGKTPAPILAPLFRDPRAIGFCLLALALTGIGAWGLYTAYQHAVGNIPYGGTLVTIGLVALVVSGLLVLLLWLSATLIGAAGGGP